VSQLASLAESFCSETIEEICSVCFALSLVVESVKL